MKIAMKLMATSDQHKHPASTSYRVARIVEEPYVLDTKDIPVFDIGRLVETFQARGAFERCITTWETMVTLRRRIV